jgi:hypothetical protein
MSKFNSKTWIKKSKRRVALWSFRIRMVSRKPRNSCTIRLWTKGLRSSDQRRTQTLCLRSAILSSYQAVIRKIMWGHLTIKSRFLNCLRRIGWPKKLERGTEEEITIQIGTNQESQIRRQTTYSKPMPISTATQALIKFKSHLRKVLLIWIIGSAPTKIPT